MPTDMPLAEARRPLFTFIAACKAALSCLSRGAAYAIRPEMGDDPATDPAEDARLRSDFVQDMLCANPAAFQSEQDVQAMLHCFPGRF